MLGFLILLQSVAPAPDIEIDARIEARRVTVEKRGEASLTVTANPDAGSSVTVEAPNADGRRTLRNVKAHVRAEARLAAGKAVQAGTETSPAASR